MISAAARSKDSTVDATYILNHRVITMIVRFDVTNTKREGVHDVSHFDALLSGCGIVMRDVERARSGVAVNAS